MKAIVLIEIEPRDIQYALRDLKRNPSIHEVHLTFGPYDAIAIILSDDLSALGKIVEFEIQTIPGVLRTCTCLMVEGELMPENRQEPQIAGDELENPYKNPVFSTAN